MTLKNSPDQPLYRKVFQSSTSRLPRSSDPTRATCLGRLFWKQATHRCSGETFFAELALHLSLQSMSHVPTPQAKTTSAKFRKPRMKLPGNATPEKTNSSGPATASSVKETGIAHITKNQLTNRISAIQSLDPIQLTCSEAQLPTKDRRRQPKRLLSQHFSI